MAQYTEWVKWGVKSSRYRARIRRETGTSVSFMSLTYCFEYQKVFVGDTYTPITGTVPPDIEYILKNKPLLPSKT